MSKESCRFVVEEGRRMKKGHKRGTSCGGKTID